MKYLNMFVAGTLLLAIAGCQTASTDADLAQEQQAIAADTWLVQELSDMAVRNAIIAQHTLYPHHFVDNGAELTGLGKRDLGVLAAHFKANPGLLNTRRGNASDALYQGRVQTVTRVLEEAGVNKTRLVFSDGLPGGTGVSSERVLKIIEESYKKSASNSGYQASSPLVK